MITNKLSKIASIICTFWIILNVSSCCMLTQHEHRWLNYNTLPNEIRGKITSENSYGIGFKRWVGLEVAQGEEGRTYYITYHRIKLVILSCGWYDIPDKDGKTEYKTWIYIKDGWQQTTTDKEIEWLEKYNGMN